MNPWTVDTPVFLVGGRHMVRRDHAPLGRTLLYRRADGQYPPVTGGADLVRKNGWLVNLGDRGLGDTLLGLALVRALHEVTGHDNLDYHGPRPTLMCRCSLPITAHYAPEQHIIRTGDTSPVPFLAVPERPPTWLDLVEVHGVEVHAALPMRYYLSAEQTLGTRLSASYAPTPTFRSIEAVRPFHVVFVSATSWPDRKDYGLTRFAAVADALASRRRSLSWQFSLITGNQIVDPAAALGMEVLAGPDATDCIDVFASAELVIGNDTGLTHLAALTTRRDGGGPHVVGLYSRHAHTKWTTGSARHHAVATPFAQMLAAADRCPVRDNLDDSLWSASATLADLPAEAIADFAGRQAGWW